MAVSMGVERMFGSIESRRAAAARWNLDRVNVAGDPATVIWDQVKADLEDLRKGGDLLAEGAAQCDDRLSFPEYYVVICEPGGKVSLPKRVEEVDGQEVWVVPAGSSLSVAFYPVEGVDHCFGLFGVGRDHLIERLLPIPGDHLSKQHSVLHPMPQGRPELGEPMVLCERGDRPGENSMLQINLGAPRGARYEVYAMTSRSLWDLSEENTHTQHIRLIVG